MTNIWGIARQSEFKRLKQNQDVCPCLANNNTKLDCSPVSQYKLMLRGASSRSLSNYLKVMMRRTQAYTGRRTCVVVKNSPSLAFFITLKLLNLIALWRALSKLFWSVPVDHSDRSQSIELFGIAILNDKIGPCSHLTRLLSGNREIIHWL